MEAVRRRAAAAGGRGIREKSKHISKADLTERLVICGETLMEVFMIHAELVRDLSRAGDLAPAHVDALTAATERITNVAEVAQGRLCGLNATFN